MDASLLYLSEFFQPGPNDVIVGRGRRPQVHEGNLRMRQLVNERLQEYSSAKKKHAKSEIIDDIVKQVCSNGVFVKDGGPLGRWCLLEMHNARTSVAQQFRDCLCSKYSSSKAVKQDRRKHHKAMRYLIAERTPQDSTTKPTNHDIGSDPYYQSQTVGDTGLPKKTESSVDYSMMRLQNIMETAADIEETGCLLPRAETPLLYPDVCNSQIDEALEYTQEYDTQLPTVTSTSLLNHAGDKTPQEDDHVDQSTSLLFSLSGAIGMTAPETPNPLEPTPLASSNWLFY